MQERGKSEISRALQQFMPGCSLTGEVAKQLLGSMSGPKRDGRGTKDTKAWALKDIETSHRHIGRAHWEVILYLHGLGAYKKVNPKRTTWNVATAAGIFACHLVQQNQLKLASQSKFLHLHMVIVSQAASQNHGVTTTVLSSP